MPDKPRPIETIADITGMDLAEINARWDEVRDAAAGRKPIPVDLTDASVEVLAQAAADPSRWDEVKREMARRQKESTK